MPTTVAAWRPLKGIVTPLATPLSSQDTIDEQATQRLLDHVIEGGVSGIFLLGSTGEGPSLSYAARRHFVQFSCQHAQCHTQIPILVSVTDTCFAETVRMAQLAHDCGAAAIVLAPPYYFTMGQDELMHYTEQVLQSIPPGLPVLLYNIDFLTKTKWHVETVRSLALRYPQIIVGIKDSSGDLEYFEQLCSIKHEIPDFTVLMGPEHLLPQAIQAGADGGVNGGSNVLPDLFVALYQALAVTVEQQQEQEQEKVQALTQQLNDFQNIYALDDSSEHPFSRLIRGTKCALVALGVIKTMHVNLPFSNPTDEHVTRARDILTKIGYVTP